MALQRLREAAKELGVDPVTLRREIAAGRISFVRIGQRSIRIHPSEIARIISEGTIPARGKRARRAAKRSTVGK